MSLETPRYELVREAEGYQLRRYAPYVVAEVEVQGTATEAGNRAFSLLAGYIFGKNAASESIGMTAPVTQVRSEKIAMTAPVIQQPGGGEGEYIVQFTMPSKYTLASLPRPLDPRVQLRAVTGRLVAVHQYRGGWSEERYDREELALYTALARDGLKAKGPPYWARYNSPFSLPAFRHNEIWIDVRE